MKILELLPDSKGKAIVECPACFSTFERHAFPHRKNPEGLCVKCTNTIRNQSDEMRNNNAIRIDEVVKLNNSETNGIYILHFTDKRTKCWVRCTTCNTEYERRYSPDIYEEVGCKKCARVIAAANTVKHQVRYDSRLYTIYNSMLSRTGVYNKKREDTSYIDKGIIVCDEWLNDRHTFFDWALANGYTDELKIDRENNDGNYTPDNCRWVTQAVQSRNTKVLRSTNTSGYRGVSLTQSKHMYRTRIRVGGPDIQLHTGPNPKVCAYYYDKYVRDNKLEHTKNFTDVEFASLEANILALE